MKIVDKRPIMKAVHFSEICPGDVFRYNDIIYISVYDYETEEIFGVELATGQVTRFIHGDFVYPIVAELYIMS